MKILMVGALYFANFGDLLFAKMFYQELLKNHEKSDIYVYETPVYKLNEACRKELGYDNHFKLSMLKDMDVLVYISGAYFDLRQVSFKAHLSWYLKYILPGQYFAKHNKKIYVLGVGGGDFFRKRSETTAKKILDAAQVVCVRNVDTKTRFQGIGVRNQILVHGDTAQAQKQPNKENFNPSTQKRLFLHVIPQEEKVKTMMENVIPAVKCFVDENPEYTVVVGYDGIIREKYKAILKEVVAYFGSAKAEFFDYNSIDGMLETLSNCAVIVTPKLHVGILGCSFGKSVICSAVDYHKTHRYYEDIGYPERCFSLKETKKAELVDALRKYANDGVVVPKEKIESAKSTLQICSNIK